MLGHGLVCHRVEDAALGRGKRKSEYPIIGWDILLLDGRVLAPNVGHAVENWGLFW
jgi:hypothetical protein